MGILVLFQFVLLVCSLFVNMILGMKLHLRGIRLNALNEAVQRMAKQLRTTANGPLFSEQVKTVDSPEAPE